MPQWVLEDDKMSDKERATFSSSFGYVMVAAGAAIGLGNIWRFPYMAYRDGGGIFILLYILIVALVGKAGIEVETAIGRHGRTNAIASYAKVNEKSRVVGWIGVLFTFMLDMYYVVVGGYVLKYALDYLVGRDFGDTIAYYNEYVSNPILPLVFTAILLSIVCYYLVSGITKKVEKVSKVIMPLLLVLLVICGVGALISSPTAINGLSYYLVPDFSKLTFKTVSDVCVQVMFSIGTGWCLYVTLGANVKKEENIRKSANNICICDTAIAILAGFVVIPSVVGAGSKMAGGPSLVFMAMPQIFAGLPAGRFLGFLFFSTLVIAVITSMFTFIEIPAVVVRDYLKVSHEKATVITTIAVFVFSILCSWSQGEGLLSGVRIPWLSAQGIDYYSIIDWVDCFSSYVLMPIGNIAVAIFIAKIWGFKNYEKELTADGRDGKLGPVSKGIIVIGIPLFSIIALLNVFGIVL